MTDAPNPTEAAWFVAVVALAVGMVLVAGAATVADDSSAECTATVHYTNGSVEQLPTPEDTPCDELSVAVLDGANATTTAQSAGS
ncbi:hypothetical protein [Natrinema thermotolerans]|uniref:hypothetical protein n=1 Tax=Natrinema thermotolerans TaxID=121872 RepID=UPI000678DBC6|nr:hypothetical protein [Natrinema thermotolerans]QCC57239.1 hypothetical protein DVR14_00770 [Natrinema thermotolerans]